MGCKEPIGAEPYRLDTGMARYGTLFVYHERCWPGVRGGRRRRRPEGQ
jgi:hypothetical protein